MTDIVTVAAPIADGERAARVFAGEILVFPGLPAVRALRDYADELIRAALASDDPPAAQIALDPDDYVARIDAVQKPFRRDKEARDLFAEVLAATGADPARTFYDWLHLRALPDGASHTARNTRPTHLHRDSWGSGVMQQTNWWTPVYPITAECTIALHPGYWARPLANSSDRWEFEKARDYRKSAPAAGRAAGTAYPTIPEPLEPVDTASELRPVIAPCDLLCFSGAQLHGTVPNATGRARFSLEVRTVSLDDVLGGRGAPNIDSGGQGPRYEWFRRCTDGVLLPEVLARA